jgi:hypothetical protein
MTLSQKREYSNVEELRAVLNNLKTRKFRLDCGHHVTFGFFLGNDVLIINGSVFRIICSQCAR